MENTEIRRHRRRRRGLLALLIAGTTLVSATSAALSLAVFTSQAAVAGNGFTAGTIVLGVSPASAILTAGAMMPGDTINGSALVSDTGTAQLRYSVTGIATNPDTKGLASQITVTIRRADGNAGASCAAFTGDQLFSGVVGYATGNLIGNPLQGAQAGDRVLNASSSETLCFRATLPLATGDAYQGATTSMTFTFNAEQTANNP